MTIKRNYKEQETLKERGTKRYQERLIEEEEAERLIKEYEEELERDKSESLPAVYTQVSLREV